MLAHLRVRLGVQRHRLCRRSPLLGGPHRQQHLVRQQLLLLLLLRAAAALSWHSGCALLLLAAATAGACQFSLEVLTPAATEAAATGSNRKHDARLNTTHKQR